MTSACLCLTITPTLTSIIHRNSYCGFQLDAPQNSARSSSLKEGFLALASATLGPTFCIVITAHALMHSHLEPS